MIEIFLMTDAAENVQVIAAAVFIVCLVVIVYGMIISRRNRFRGAGDWMMAIPMTIAIIHNVIYYSAVFLARCGIIVPADPIELFTSWSVMLRLHEGVTILGGVLHWVVLIRERAKLHARITGKE